MDAQTSERKSRIHVNLPSATIRIRSPHFREQRIRIVGKKKGLVFLAAVFFAVVDFLAVVFFAVLFLAVVFFRRSLTLRRPLGTLFGEQFDGALMGERFDGFRARHRNVGNAVGNVRSESPVFDHDILFTVRVYTKLGERGLSGGTSALFRLCINVERLFKGDREDFFLRPNRPRVGTLSSGTGRTARSAR